MLHVTDADVADEMTVTALARGREGARVVALYPIEVPASRALDEAADEEERQAHTQLGEAEALGHQYGVTVIGRLVRTRHAGRALVDEARARGSRGDRARLAGPLAARRRTCSARPSTTCCATRPARSWSGRRPSGAGRAGRRRRPRGLVR